MAKTRARRKAVRKSSPKRFRDLTPEDIEKLPPNATGNGPKDNEAIARFELMIENIRSMLEDDDPLHSSLINRLEDYCTELEKLLYRGPQQTSSITQFIPIDEQQRLRYHLDQLVNCYGDALIEYVAFKISKLEAKFHKQKRLEQTDHLMCSAMMRFLQRAQGRVSANNLNILPHEWACFAPNMTGLESGVILPQLEQRLRSLECFDKPATSKFGNNHELVSSDFSTGRVDMCAENAYEPEGLYWGLDGVEDVSPEPTIVFEASSDDNETDHSSFGANNVLKHGDNLSEFDSSVTTDSETARSDLPVVQGSNWLSNYDYIHLPFPENRPFEVAHSRRIDRDLTMPGYHSDGLREGDLLTTPVAHCRKPGTYTPHFKRRIPLGPYEAATSLFSWLGTTICGASEVKPHPRPGVGIIPRSVARHKKHNRNGRSKVVKPGRKQVFRLLGESSEADRSPVSAYRNSSNKIVISDE